MKKLRLLLLPFGAIAELCVLAGCWAVALVRPRVAERMMNWATRTLPTLHWYIGDA